MANVELRNPVDKKTNLVYKIMDKNHLYDLQALSFYPTIELIVLDSFL